MTNAARRAYGRQERGVHTAVDLARIVADVHGWEARPGGYIKDRDGRTVAHGWNDLSARLSARGAITRSRTDKLVVNWPKV